VPIATTNSVGQRASAIISRNGFLPDDQDFHFSSWSDQLGAKGEEPT
jgi:hypothetical protein